MLMLLRITIGWHFLYAGIDKLTNPDFTSSGYLGQAKGPLAQHFYDLIPDIDGRARFNPVDGAHAKREVADIDAYRQRFVAHYRPTQEQQAKIDDVVAQAKQDVTDWLGGLDPDLKEHILELDRLDAARKFPDTPFQQKRNWEKQTELRGKVKSWGAALDAQWKAYHNALADVLTPEQRKRGPVPLTTAERFSVDRIVTYSNLAVGVCLMAGLFTRLAAFGGGLFLLTLVLAQPDWPGLYPPPHPSAGRAFFVTKEAVEMMALFALASLPVGQWGGLDFLVRHLFVRPVYRTDAPQKGKA